MHALRHWRTWRIRIFIGAALGALIVLGWVRREAHIATTPAPLAMRNGVSDARSNATGFFAPIRDGVMNVREEEVATSPQPPDVGAPRNDPTLFVLLDVPFVSQAPFRVWDLPYKEFCEEASVLMAHYWKQGKAPPPADQIDRDLKEIQVWEIANLRTWEDTTVEEVARILRGKFGYVNTKVVRNVMMEDIKRELRAGHPIIVPAAGRQLPNPYFRRPGPLYHMLVVIGYDDRMGEFITNDVGTNTKGAGLRYAYHALYGAMGDWDPASGAADTTQKVMIVVG